MKNLANHEDKPLSQFVIEEIRAHKCLHHHVPNPKTIAVLRSAEKKEDLIYFDSLENFYKIASS